MALVMALRAATKTSTSTMCRAFVQQAHGQSMRFASGSRGPTRVIEVTDDDHYAKEIEGHAGLTVVDYTACVCGNSMRLKLLKWPAWVGWLAGWLVWLVGWLVGWLVSHRTARAKSQPSGVDLVFLSWLSNIDGCLRLFTPNFLHAGKQVAPHFDALSVTHADVKVFMNIMKTVSSVLFSGSKSCQHADAWRQHIFSEV
eukprot:6048-Prorocentrum_minimum.AAC.5